jgi:hypothetical protein
MKTIFVIAVLLGLLSASCASAVLAQTAGPVPAAPEQSISSLPSSTAAIETPLVLEPSVTPADQGKSSFEAGPGDVKLTLEILSVTTPVKQGETAAVNIKTMAGARCTISVYYTDVRSAAAGLEEKTAEASGNVTWTWKIGNDRTPGTFRIEITSRIGDHTESRTTLIEVVKRP